MITQEIVREFLDYNPETGKFTWRKRDRRWFKSERDCNAWNTRFAGKPAFITLTDGYFCGRVFSKTYRVQRIIWLYMKGEFPKEQIDHINHNRTDNRWCNLREVSNQENGKNRTKQRNNFSNQTGVCWDKRTKKWRAYIVVNRKQIDLGWFCFLEEAIFARKSAEIKHDFHENHGI